MGPVDDERASNLTSFVETGGHLLLGARTGEKDRENQLHETLAPGPLGSVAGLEIERHETLAGDMDAEISYEDPDYAFRTWASWLAPGTGSLIDTYESGEATGRAAVVRNERACGTVPYCGCWPDGDLVDTLVTTLLADAGTKYTTRLPIGVRIAERAGYSWVMNFTGDSVTLEGGRRWGIQGLWGHRRSVRPGGPRRTGPRSLSGTTLNESRATAITDLFV